jgi:hypothetical protein
MRPEVSRSEDCSSVSHHLHAFSIPPTYAAREELPYCHANCPPAGPYSALALLYITAAHPFILHCSSSAGTLDVGLPNNMKLLNDTSTSSHAVHAMLACLPQARASDVARRSLHGMCGTKVLNAQAILPDHARHVIVFAHKSFA